MSETFWTLFCGDHHTSKCTLQFLQTCFGITLSFITLCICLFHKEPPKHNHRFHYLPLLSALFNGFIGSLDLFLGIWVLHKDTNKPLALWLVISVQGFTWLFINLVVCLRGTRIKKPSLRLLSVFSFFYALVSTYSSVSAKEIEFKTVLDVLLLLPGSVLLLLTAYKGYRFEDSVESSLYEPLNVGGYNEKTDFDKVSEFARAGLFSKLSFWWLNPLIKRGNVKDLEEEDIPNLREEERAETCYSLFEANLNDQKRRLSGGSCRPSILKVTVLCVWREVLISGCFAFMKIVSVSSGPLLLNAFILVAEGNERFRYEGLVLAVLLFIAKSVESLSQRQWYFRSRLVGLRVRSLLTAAIYKKQLRLNTSSRLIHSGGEIMNYATVDAYRIGEFPFWFHQLWTTSFQLLIALGILFHSVGVATFSALAVIVVTVLCNAPIAKLQNKFQSELMTAQDERLKACNESLVNMKVLKLYAWESHFKNVIEKLRNIELISLRAVQMRKAYNAVLFWSSPVLVSAATFATCYFLNIPLRASNVFTFVATLRLVQDPVRMIPDVIGVTIQAKVAFSRIATFLEAPELQGGEKRRKKRCGGGGESAIVMKSASFSWEEKGSVKPNLRNVSLEVKFGEKVAVCGEVGSGKSTLLAAILGETPCVSGTIDFYGTIAYVSQTAWIQTGTIRENILFGGVMDEQRYRETVKKSCLDKDLELLPDGDQTEIGERGVNLSGGQKQRIQLARALYQDADIYLLDDPFSAVDAHTATSLFKEYVMDALAGKAVLLVTHQVDFLPAFDSVLLMSDGEIIEADTYQELLAKSKDFQELVNAHRETAGSERVFAVESPSKPVKEIKKVPYTQSNVLKPSRLIKQEVREKGDTGLKPYIQYLNQNKGYIFFLILSLAQVMFGLGQVLQNSWMASNVENPQVTTLKLILVYLLIGLISVLCLLVRSICVVIMCMRSSTSLFSHLLNSLFRAPMSFYDSTPLGRILSRVSSDLSIVDLDVPFGLTFVVASTVNTCFSLGVLAVVTWQVLFVSVPMIYLALRLQKYYFQTAKELMRINGTTKSLVANHLAESVAGAITIRAFDEEERFFKKSLTLIDTNASPFLHSFAANEWLIQRLETVSAIVLASTAFCMVLLPTGTFSSGFIGMALSYGLSLNMGLVYSVQNQCYLANWIISVERLNQYTHLTPEAPEVIEETRPPVNWPVTGRVEISDLQIRYRRESPLVLKGISCVFEGGDKIGIVGRTGSGKTTLISALFRLVEPVGGKIVVDGVDISKIGVHDLRSRFGIIPQDPTLFNGTVRYNLDPLCQHTDAEIWEVLGKCQLKDVVQEKENGLDSLVVEDGSNWSMGQRQLFCLGRAVLRRSRVLVLDEATASIDNATDLILQKTIRREFADCTVITVAHRIPTVMDCTMVLSISDGRIVEYESPMKLMENENSLFGKLVKEYWSHYHSADSH